MRELGISDPRFSRQSCAHHRIWRQRREIVASAVFARAWFTSVPYARGSSLRRARAMIANREGAGAKAARTSPDGAGALTIRQGRPPRSYATSCIQALVTHSRPDAASMDTPFRRPLFITLASPALSASGHPVSWTHFSKAPSAPCRYPYRSRKRRPISAPGGHDARQPGPAPQRFRLILFRSCSYFSS